MEQKTSSDKRFALLIDADNVSARYIKPILNELSKYGTVTVKRIYGDWTLSLHAKWKDALLENSITPIQQFGYTQGKNATDSAMIIDAMDILYTNSVDGFCIVSSDSDFTRLASRLREGGHMVIGMGEKKTPTPFRRACDVFTTLELLIDKREKSGNNGPSMSKEEVEQAVVDIITDNQNNGKATGLGEVGSRLLKRYPDFDVRSYGTNLLSKLLSEFPRIRITRDHNSIAVELADAADKTEPSTTVQQNEPEGAPEQEAPSTGASPTSTNTPEGNTASEAEKGDEAPAPAKRSRRSHRVSAGASHEKAKPAVKDDSEAETEASSRAQDRTADADDMTRQAADEATSVPSIVAEEAPGNPAEAKPTKKPSRRRRRKPAEKEPAGEIKNDNQAQPEEPPAAEATAEDEKTTAQETLPDAPPAARDASQPSLASEETSKATPKPKTRRGRKPKAAAEQAPAEHDLQPAASATPEPHPQPKPNPEPMATPQPEPSSTPKPKARRGRKPKARPQSDEKTPQDFIRQMVLDAGATGIELSQIGDAVRGEFKDFKVRDLGFSRLQHYVESIDDFTIEKIGKSTYVKLAD